LDFTVERKKHTVVVRNPEDYRLYAFMKGADEAVFPLLRSDEADRDELEAQKDAVDAFAEDGLRTLVFAMRVFDAGLSE